MHMDRSSLQIAGGFIRDVLFFQPSGLMVWQVCNRALGLRSSVTCKKKKNMLMSSTVFKIIVFVALL